MSTERSSIPTDTTTVTDKSTLANAPLRTASWLSADTWAVLAALALAALVKLHILNTVAW